MMTKRKSLSSRTKPTVSDMTEETGDVWGEIGGLPPDLKPQLPDPSGLTSLMTTEQRDSAMKVFEKFGVTGNIVERAEISVFLKNHGISASHEQVILWHGMLNGCAMRCRGNPSSFVEEAIKLEIPPPLVRAWAEKKLGRDIPLATKRPPPEQPPASELARQLDRVAVLKPQNWHHKHRSNIAKKHGLNGAQIGAFLMILLHQATNEYDSLSVNQRESLRKCMEDFCGTYIKRVCREMNGEEEQARQAVVREIYKNY